MIQKDLIKDDLYAAVNGEWLKKAVIPEDRPRIGGFTDLVIGVEAVSYTHLTLPTICSV